MLTRPYGSTGKHVSAIGFGAMRFPDQNNVEACASLVKTAYDAGINYFDTAIGYGKSEELCGVAFAEMQKTRAQRPFYVATKTFAASETDVRRELETSLTRMKLPYVDFYHVWCVLSPDAWKERKAGGVLKAFEKMKAEGLVKHICVSSHMSGSDIGSVLEEYPFDGVLLGYSAMNFAFREAALEAAAKLNRGVVVMNPLGGGVIPQFPDRFAFVKTRPDETVVEGALRFLINDPRITVSLVGFSTVEQIREACRAVDGFQPIPPAKLAEIRASVKQAFNELCTGCQYCDDCPQGIPVPKFMDAYNQYMLQGKAQELVNRLKWHWGIQAETDYLQKCTECGQCEAACTQHLPIIQRLKEIRAELEKAVAAAKAPKPA